MKKTSIAVMTFLATSTSMACTDLPGLEGKMMKSKASAAEILVSTMNRLGYGIHSRSWLNKRTISNIEKKYGKRVAVILISHELRLAFKQMANPHFFPYRTAASETPNKGYFRAYQGLATIPAYRKDLVDNKGWTNTQVRSLFRQTQQYRRILDNVNLRKFNPQAKILDMWSNHFNVNAQKSAFTHVNFELALKRQSCGTFANMLKMTAKHPAMLHYLDNRLNTKMLKNKQGKVVSNLNENYGREIVELHTLGTGPIVRYDKNGKPVYAYYVGDAHKYDEILESTKVLSGFKFNFSDYKFKFHANLQEPGKKYFPKMFGKKVVIGQGYNQSMRFLNLLAGHNRTKWNVCTKLVKSLYGFHPGRGTVKACVNAYGKQGNLKKMYNSVILSDVFFQPNLFGIGVKSPTESMVGATRALGMTIASVKNQDNLSKVRRILAGVRLLGRELYNFGAPTGQLFDHKILKSSTYVANRIDAFKRITFGTNLKWWGKLNVDLEKYAVKQSKKIGKQRTSDQILYNVAPVFANYQTNNLRGKSALFLDKADKEYKLARPVKSTVLRAYASGPGIRK